MKQKLTAIILGLILSVSIVAGLIACDKQPTKDAERANKPSPKEVYAISAFSGISYLSATEKPHVNALSLTVEQGEGEAKDSRPDKITDDGVKELKNCLVMFDGALSGGAIKQTLEKNNSSEEALKDYAFCMTITVVGQNEVKMYYDEIDTVTKEEIDDDGEVEKEISTTISGVLVSGDKKYDVNGKREVEEENGEMETSIEFITYSAEDRGNFVKIEYSVEVENGETETSYEYEIFEGGVSVQKTEIEIENENGKMQLKLEVEAGQTEKEFKVECIGENKYLLKYETETDEAKIIVEKISDGYKFIYENGYEETVTVD